LPKGLSTDFVTLLIRLFRKGVPFCILYNHLSASRALDIPSESNPKASKKSVYDFLSICQKNLALSQSDLFMISDVFSNNISDLKKVITSVSRIVDLFDESNGTAPILDGPAPPLEGPLAKAVNEILQTERRYANDLAKIENYVSQLQAQDIIAADKIPYLFPNLRHLIDFETWLLIGIESNADVDLQSHCLGLLFAKMENDFNVYQTYALNQNRAMEIAQEEVESLQKLSYLIEPTYELQSLLILPVQRLCKYHLLLKQLIKYTPPDFPHQDDLNAGYEAMKRAANMINEARRKVENAQALKAFRLHTEEWNGLNSSTLGDLLYHGVYTVTRDNSERDHHIYLFQNYLVCCRDSDVTRSRSVSLQKKPKKRELVVKRFIKVSDIDAVVQIPNSYELKVYGNPHSGIPEMTIHFRNEESRTQWYTAIRQLLDQMIAVNTSKESTILGADSSASSNSSVASLHMHKLSLDSVSTKRQSLLGLYGTVQEEDESDSNTGTNSFVSETLEIGTSNINSEGFSPSAAAGHAAHRDSREQERQMKVIVEYYAHRFTIAISPSTTYESLIEKVVKKVRICGGQENGDIQSNLRIRYRDEDGDYILLMNDEDVQLALE
ncbi:hypothetical protein CANCADRAFT_14730, partial [Tortispora caseinolytica NRRL Y-17796]